MGAVSVCSSSSCRFGLVGMGCGSSVSSSGAEATSNEVALLSNDAKPKADGIRQQCAVLAVDTTAQTEVDATAQAKTIFADDDKDPEDILRDSPSDSIWQCRLSEERREWVERNKEKLGKQDAEGRYKIDKLADALANDQFTPAELVKSPLNDITSKLKTADRTIVMGQQRNFRDELKKQGHGFYHPVQFAVQRDKSHELGSYLFKSILGRGSFGEVYKVYTRRTDREDCFAIKFCATEESTKKDYGLAYVTKLEDAQEEVAKMKSIKSEVVVGVLNYGELCDLGLFWSCFELCLGGELDGRLKPQEVRGERGIVAESNAWRWMSECVSGLVHMHDALMMHNDLKPEVPSRRS